MAWQLDNPWVLEDLDNAPIDPAFDGRNLWVAQNDGSVLVIEFWGPYAELDNDDTNARYKAEEFDYVNAGSQGPSLRIIGRLTKPFMLNPGFGTRFADTILSIKYHNGKIVMSCRSNLANPPNATLENFISVVATNKLVPGEFTTFAHDISFFGGGPQSDIAVDNGRIVWATAPPPTQTGTDIQRLFSRTLTGASLGLFDLPGVKQTERRYIASANNHFYVSAFNELSVLKFDADTFALVDTIEVNRDVERLFSNGNDVYVISSLKAKSDLSGSEFPTSMVSKIDETDTVTSEFGIVHPSIEGNVPAMAFDASHTWFTNAAYGFQRVTNATELTIVSDDLGTLASDMTFADEHKALLVTDNEVEPFELSGLNGEVTGIFISPPTHYEWYNGVSFETIAVPRYLFITTEEKLVCVMLPKALKFQNDFSINQYTAVSSGTNSYKGG